MDTLPLLVILAVSAALFAFLLRRRRARVASRTGEAAAVAGLAAVNCAGAVGLAWWAATILYHDGLMAEEHAICGVSIALLAAITVGALALDRRGRVKTALALLAVGALPTAAIYGFLFYLEANPIAWR